MGEKNPSPHVNILARDLRDIIRDELYGLKKDLHHKHITSEDIQEVANVIVKRALLSPK
jgi:hypothetical protein